jgi:hypothetical protein
MTRIFAALALAGMLGACAVAPEQARPVSARLAGDQLAVGFSDGATCRATMTETGGQGAFPDCANGASYSVDITGKNPLGTVLGALVSPYATIDVTDARGRVTTFRTPVSRDWTGSDDWGQ